VVVNVLDVFKVVAR